MKGEWRKYMSLKVQTLLNKNLINDKIDESD